MQKKTSEPQAKRALSENGRNLNENRQVDSRHSRSHTGMIQSKDDNSHMYSAGREKHGRQTPIGA